MHYESIKVPMSVQVPQDLLDRIRALVRATPPETLNSFVESALRAAATAHPLANKELPVPVALKPGRRRRSRRVSSDFVVLIEQ